MSEPRRQHPVAAVSQVLTLLRENILTLIVLLFVGSGSESNLFFYGILASVAAFAVAGVVGWWRFTYQVEGGELRIKQGIFVRKKLYLSNERIQVIDISAGVLQRMFNLVSVEVKTAGSTSKEAKIDAISRGEADRIKQLLRERQPTEPEAQDDEAVEEKIYALNFRDLLVTASTSGNLGIAMSVVGGAYSQVDQVIDENQMMRFIEWLIPASVGVSIILSTLLFLLVISWLLSVAGTLVKYYGFTLKVTDNELLIRRGLFEQKQLAIPFNRIQAIQIREELLRQPLGYASVILESAGYGENQVNSTTLFPLIRRQRARDFIREVVPEYDVAPQTVRPPRVALRRYLLRMFWGSLLLIVPAWAFIPYGAYSAILLLPALLLGYAQYRDAEIGAAGDHTLLLRSRLLSRTTALVKKYRVQSAETQQNPFQRRLGLVSYAVTVTSGSSGQTFQVRELSESAGTRFLDWVSELQEPPAEEEERDTDCQAL